ncbi:MAG: M14 family metallopeptidase [Candidatus Marinimicrobia bacterium]|nr:M14 family metallopeptidase [Candidatus Neomarinimicrobiota bacterium]
MYNKKLIPILLFIISYFSIFSNSCEKLQKPLRERWKTPCEISQFKETPRYDETILFCKRLGRVSKFVKYRSFGKSSQGRELPLLIVDFDKRFSPNLQKRTGKPVILIQACIHAGEPDGKDAGLMFLRDVIIFGKYKELVKDVTLLFIPIFNVDGHERFGKYNRINQNGPIETGWRTTAQNFNLNRDFLKADAPEMKAWLKLFREWLPDFLVDIHVTDGADYQYVVTYGLEIRDVLDEPLRVWSNNIFLPQFISKMRKSGYEIFPYIHPRRWNDVESGLIIGVPSPRYSNGYGIVQNRIFLLIENHMLKDYKQRVLATYETIRNIVEIVSSERYSLKESVSQSDKMTSNMETGSAFYLNYRVDFSDSSRVKFLGKKYRHEYSDISGSEYIIWEDEPDTFDVFLFSKIFPADSVMVPYAYIIPPEWSDITTILILHGVNVKYLNRDLRLPVHTYKFFDFSWDSESYEGHHRVKFSLMDTVVERTFPKGSVLVLMNQRVNKVILHALEPKAPDSFLRWGFFNVIFERKEYAEMYVLEKLAREMITSNSSIYNEFLKRLKIDAEFRDNPRERLHFFYKRSPYWDKNYCMYPVGRVFKPFGL